MSADKKVDYKTGDYLEIEFELGDLEFEATGRSAVVEKLFNLLLDKLCSGEIKVSHLREYEEEEEEEEEKFQVEEEISEKEDEASLTPGPDWDSLDTETPPESPVEREIGDN